MAIPKGKQIALAMVPKFSSILSLCGSSWIMIEVLTDRKIPKIRHPYHRLLLAMSIYDILESVWNFMSTWPIPKGTPGVYGAIGNTATCSVQGYFLTLSVAVPIYNAFLAFYYMLVIVYGYKDDHIKKNIEPIMHIIAFVWAGGTATVATGMGLINNANLWCWIAPYPAGCLDSRRYGDESSCTRGDNAWIYRWAFYFAPLWGCILVATVCTLMVYRKVRRYDAATLRYRRAENMSYMGERLSQPKGFSIQSNFSEVSNDDNVDSVRFDIPEGTFNKSEQVRVNASDELKDDHSKKSLKTLFKKLQRKSFASEHSRSRTMEVFTQSLYYMGAFYITHVWSTSNRIYQQLNNGNSVFGITLIHSFFDPLQGFLNYFVYQRPRYMKIRKDFPEIGRLGALKLCLRFSYMESPEKSKSMNTSGEPGGGDVAGHEGQPKDSEDDGDVIWENHGRSDASDVSSVELDTVPEEPAAPVVVATDEDKQVYEYGN